MYENWKILKTDYKEHSAEYTQVAKWCRENRYSIDDDGEYYKVVKDEPSQEDLRNAEIAAHKAYLSATDYVVIKIAEGVATAEEYAEVLAERSKARERINQLGE